MILKLASAALKQVGHLALFDRTGGVGSAWQIVRWWEARRMTFNLVVGAVGIATCAIMSTTSLVAERCVGEPIGMPDPFFGAIAVIVYGVGANVLYTGGWITEIVVGDRWRGPEDFGRTALVLGLLFSIALTFAPAVLIVASVAYQCLTHG